jgi:hypothetical protein
MKQIIQDIRLGKPIKQLTMVIAGTAFILVIAMTYAILFVPQKDPEPVVGIIAAVTIAAVFILMSAFSSLLPLEVFADEEYLIVRFPFRTTAIHYSSARIVSRTVMRPSLFDSRQSLLLLFIRTSRLPLGGFFLYQWGRLADGSASVWKASNYVTPVDRFLENSRKTDSSSAGEE